MDLPLDLAPGARPLFSRWTILPVFALAAVVTAAFAIWNGIDRSELLYEIDPDLKAGAIGAGVFVGILVDAVYASAAAQGIGVRRVSPGVRMLAGLVVIPVFCVFGATLLARRVVAYRAFHGLPVVTVPMDFTVTGMSSGKSGVSLDLLGAPGERTISLRVDGATYRAAGIGQHLALPVQTGRGGVRRMIPPPGGIVASDLHG